MDYMHAVVNVYSSFCVGLRERIREQNNSPASKSQRLRETDDE